MGITKRDRRTNLEKEIDDVIAYMRQLQPGSDEYSKAARNLNVLYDAKGKVKDRRVSRDTMWLVGANLIGLVMVLGWEQAHVIAGKAFGLVMRGRI